MIGSWGGSILRLIFSTPYIFPPIYLKTLVITVRLIGGWYGYKLSRIGFGEVSFSLRLINLSRFLGSIWFTLI